MQGEKLVNSGGGIRLISEGKENPRVETREKSAIEEAVEQLNRENGSGKEFKWGCFWYPDFRGLELFFCFDQNNPSSPTLFHWKGARGKTVSWVESIGKGTMLKFKERGSQTLMHRQLQALLSWTHKWSTNGTAFEPSKHCTITKLDPNYQLSCSLPENSGTTFTKSWNIPKSMVETPNPNVELKGRV